MDHIGPEDSHEGTREPDDFFEVVDLLLENASPRVREHRWATRIAVKHFVRGLSGLTEPATMAKALSRVLRDADPVYGAILDGLDDPVLASTFVAYWKIAQTMATQSRFWLEDAIAEILVEDPSWKGKSRKVYTNQMLGAGYYQEGLGLAELGEEKREELLTLRKPWKVLVQRSALEAIDRQVGIQERGGEKVGPENWWSTEETSRDVELLSEIEHSLRGPPPEEVSILCNLLIVEPPKLDGGPHVWGFRFVNARTIGSPANRKQERVNLLRLYAFLAQEKIFRDPKYLEVAVAEIVPRHKQVSGPAYFSLKTYWHANRFWDFVGVPFEAVHFGITAAGLLLGENLRGGLQGFLSDARDFRNEGPP